jgi:S1-C subfamily serine protease
MKKLLLLLLLLFIPIVCFGQFEMQRNNIKSTNYFNNESIKNYWKDSNQEFDDLEGIYEPLGSVDESVLGYVLGIIKVNDYYEIIMLGQPYGSRDVNKGGVKATAKKMPTEGVYNLRWRMANARNIEKGFIIVENTVLDITLTRFGSASNSKYVKTFAPSLTSNSNPKKPIGWAGNGSGLIISKSGYIVTNHHVIEDADDIEVEFILNGEVRNFNAEIVQSDKVNDLAIIKIFDMNFDGMNEPPYNFKLRGSDVGTKVYAFGYPMALSIMGKEIKVTDGMISSKTGFDGNITTYQITAPIQGGNSGGPLFDEQANLIGINSSGIRKDIADNVAYSIKTSYVSNLLDVLPKSIELPSSTRLKSLSLIEQIKEISKYVVLIKVK